MKFIESVSVWLKGPHITFLTQRTKCSFDNATLIIELVPILCFFPIQQKLKGSGHSWHTLRLIQHHMWVQTWCASNRPILKWILCCQFHARCKYMQHSALNLRTSTHVRHLHVDVAAKTSSILCNFTMVFCFLELNCHQFSCICHTCYDISFQEANNQAVEQGYFVKKWAQLQSNRLKKSQICNEHALGLARLSWSSWNSTSQVVCCKLPQPSQQTTSQMVLFQTLVWLPKNFQCNWLNKTSKETLLDWHMTHNHV